MCGMGEQPVEAEGGTPPWCAAGEVREIIDADALIAAGEVPLVRAMRGARRLQRGERLEIAVSFEPVPLVEALREKGYRTFTRRSGKGRFTVIGATVDAG
jgi:hypothetical protein